MSYSRWGPDSDVYVYRSINGPLICCSCFSTESVDELEGHLKEHEREGAIVDVEGIMAEVRADFPTGSTR